MIIAERVADICGKLPGAFWTDERTREHPCWKLSEKMFAMIGYKADGVSVKTQNAETATMLIDAGLGIQAPYFHKSWIRLLPDTPDEELRFRVEGSYEIIRNSFPRMYKPTWPYGPEG